MGWPSEFHARLPLIKCIIMNCICILEQGRSSVVKCFFFSFSFMFSNKTTHICCENERQTQSNILNVCLAQKSSTRNDRLVSNIQVAVTLFWIIISNTYRPPPSPLRTEAGKRGQTKPSESCLSFLQEARGRGGRLPLAGGF